MSTDTDLTCFAEVAVTHLRAAFPAETLLEQQTMCVAEEGGEVLKAYRRWRGLARRSGTFEELQAELADVLLASYVTALLIDKDGIEEFTRRSTVASAYLSRDLETGEAVRVLNRAASRVAFAFDEPTYPSALLADLGQVVAHTIRAADLLDVDLEAAWRAKAATILDRPWRDEPAERAS